MMNKTDPLVNVGITLEMNEKGYKQLAEQKLELLKALDKGTLSDQVNGIIHLIDAIQDQTVGRGFFSEKIVFPLSGEKEEPAEAIIAIEKCEMTKHESSGIGRNHCEEKEWEGTVSYVKACKDSSRIFNVIDFKTTFKYNWFVGDDNGGDGSEVTGQKPKGMKKKVWEDAVADIDAFLRNDFDQNRDSWKEE